MSALLAALAMDDSIDKDTDYTKSYVLESGLYKNAIVKMAYIEKKEAGSVWANVFMETEEGKEISENFCLLSGDAKGNKNYYIGKSDKRKHYLPGFSTFNSLCLLATGAESSKQNVEGKVVQVWNNDSKTNVATTVEAFVDLLDKPITIGIIKERKFNQTKNDSGEYVATDKVIEVNNLDKFFRNSDLISSVELLAGSDRAAYYSQWESQNTGKTKDSTGGSEKSSQTKQPSTVFAQASGASTATSGPQAEGKIFADRA